MDQIDKPEWLTTKFLEQLLQKEDKNKTQIIKHDITRCVPKGANFLSSVLRIDIDYKTLVGNDEYLEDKLSLAIKIPLKDDVLAVLNKSGIIDREVEAYYDLLPKLNEILISNGDAFITPKCYKCDVNGVLIMQNLFSDNYKMINKKDQLDYKHGIAVLKRLSQFHAASACLHEREPNLVEHVGRQLIFNYSMDPEVISILDPIQGEERIKDLIIEFEKWPETKEYVEFLRKLKPKFWETFLKAISYEKDEFVVLNHCDVYTNNILFQYNEQNEISDLKFVDLQLLRYTCPAVDFIYFIYLSIKYEVIEHQYEQLLECYIENLNYYLEKYGCYKRWRKVDFKKSLERRDIYSVIVSITLLPFMLAGNNEVGDNRDIPAYPYFEYCQNENYRKTCAKILNFFSKKVWFQNFE